MRAVLLDMDGTLVDSDGPVERAWRTWAARYGVAEADAMAAAHGGPAAGMVRMLVPHLSDAEVMEAAHLRLQLQYDDLVDVTAARGARELLAVLARRRLPWPRDERRSATGGGPAPRQRDRPARARH